MDVVRKNREESFDKLLSEAGKEPTHGLPCMRIVFKFSRLPMSLGKVPPSLLLNTPRCANAGNAVMLGNDVSLFPPMSR